MFGEAFRFSLSELYLIQIRRPYREAEHETFFKLLLRYAAEDALKMARLA